jgi:hypothetical protein
MLTKHTQEQEVQLPNIYEVEKPVPRASAMDLVPRPKSGKSRKHIGSSNTKIVLELLGWVMELVCTPAFPSYQWSYLSVLGGPKVLMVSCTRTKCSKNEFDATLKCLASSASNVLKPEMVVFDKHINIMHKFSC